MKNTEIKKLPYLPADLDQLSNPETCEQYKKAYGRYLASVTEHNSACDKNAPFLYVEKPLPYFSMKKPAAEVKNPNAKALDSNTKQSIKLA